MASKSKSKGKSWERTVNAMTMFDELFSFEKVEEEVEETIEDSDDAINEVLEN